MKIQQKKEQVLVMVGPTASGKSSAALAIAQSLGCEIVSADSMQVYCGMDIGTAKPTKQEQDLVPHHMIDVCKPCDKYTVAQYAQEARLVLADIHARGRLPLVVGGTGLYVSALLDGLNFAQSKGDGEERAQWEEYLAQNGNAALHAQLMLCDEASASRLHPNDVRRVIRALEIYTITGKPMSQSMTRQTSPYDICMVGLAMEKDVLYKRIDQRVLVMMEQGLLKEAELLLGHCGETAKHALGYKQLFAYLQGEISLIQAVEQIQQESRRYAKRQGTWFRRETRIQWLDALSGDLVASAIALYTGEK